MRRKRIRIASFLTALFLAVGAWGIGEHNLKKKYNRLVSLNEQASMIEYAAYMEEIRDSLNKCTYCSSSPMLSSLAARLWSESNCAKLSLARLGDRESHLPGTYKFLTQVGDYTLFLSDKAARGETLTVDEQSMLKKMKRYADKFTSQADYAVQLLASGSLSFGEHDAEYLDHQFETVHYSDASADSEKNVNDFPTLIYDGPFADNRSDKKSDFLKRKDIITKEEARKKAAELVGAETGKISDAGYEDGNIPSFLFSYADKTLAVTERGGYCRYLLSRFFAGEAKISVPEAINAGIEYLDKLGYRDMRENYYAEADGVLTINYVSVINGVKCYPDLIKVSVALDSGTVTAFDATQYLLNHKQRNLPVSAVDPASFDDCINSGLIIKKRSLAVIPTDGGDELFTVEYLCENTEGGDALIYINPKTRYEENILILTYSDNGILTK